MMKMKRKRWTRKDDKGLRREDANYRRLRSATLATRATRRTKVKLPAMVLSDRENKVSKSQVKSLPLGWERFDGKATRSHGGRLQHPVARLCSSSRQSHLRTFVTDVRYNTMRYIYVLSKADESPALTILPLSSFPQYWIPKPKISSHNRTPTWAPSKQASKYRKTHRKWRRYVGLTGIWFTLWKLNIGFTGICNRPLSRNFGLRGINQRRDLVVMI